MKNCESGKPSWLKRRSNEREVMLRAKADEDNLRRRTEQDIEKTPKIRAGKIRQ